MLPLPFFEVGPDVRCVEGFSEHFIQPVVFVLRVFHPKLSIPFLAAGFEVARALARASYSTFCDCLCEQLIGFHSYCVRGGLQ